MRTCNYCKTKVTNAKAIDAGWIPYFWVWVSGEHGVEPGRESDNPACGDCAAKHLQPNVDGEYEEKPLPLAAMLEVGFEPPQSPDPHTEGVIAETVERIFSDIPRIQAMWSENQKVSEDKMMRNAIELAIRIAVTETQ